MTNHSRKVHDQVMRTIKIFGVTNHIIGTAKARIVKFWKHVGYVKS